MLNKQRIFFITASCGGLYFYNKPHTKVIKIKEKNNILQRIKTYDNEIYNVVTPLSRISCYPPWWIIEGIYFNDDTEITYYGINMPIFGFYPNIYEVCN